MWLQRLWRQTGLVTRCAWRRTELRVVHAQLEQYYTAARAQLRLSLDANERLTKAANASARSPVHTLTAAHSLTALLSTATAAGLVRVARCLESSAPVDSNTHPMTYMQHHPPSLCRLPCAISRLCQMLAHLTFAAGLTDPITARHCYARGLGYTTAAVRCSPHSSS